MDRTFDELTDLIYRRHGRQFWGDIRIVHLGVAWSVKSAWTQENQHFLLLINDVFKTGVKFPKAMKLREINQCEWLLDDNVVDRPTMLPNLFVRNENVRFGELCQLLAPVGQLTSADVPWPSSNMGLLKRGEPVIVLESTVGKVGSMLRVLTHLGVGYIVRDMVGPSPSNRYKNL